MAQQGQMMIVLSRFVHSLGVCQVQMVHLLLRMREPRGPDISRYSYLRKTTRNSTTFIWNTFIPCCQYSPALTLMNVGGLKL
jgi:hypothetical protein